MEKDKRINNLVMALAYVYMEPSRGHVILEAEDNGNGFEWTSGTTVFYSPGKEFLLNLGLNYASLKAESAGIRADAAPISVLHEAEHKYAVPERK